MIKRIARRLLFSTPLRVIFGALHWYLERCEKETADARIRARYCIHPSVRWASGTLFLGDGEISVGEQTYFGHDCHLSSHPAGTRIRIGAYCAIAHGIHIRTTNYARVPHFRDAFFAPSEAADIVIGDYVWIGNHVHINAGVTIGSNVTIGANAVVTRDIPPDVIAAGVPARIIGYKASYATSNKMSREETSRDPIP